MEIIRSFLVFLWFVPSLTIYLQRAAPQYNQPFYVRSVVPKSVPFYVRSVVPKSVPFYVRSVVPGSVPRSVIEIPQLQRLYAAKRKAQKIEKNIDSEIEQILQNQVYRRNFDTAKFDDTDTETFFRPKPTNSFAAAIGAQGGAWFPGPAGAGVEGSQMLEGRANQYGMRRTQGSQAPVQQGSTRMLQGKAPARNVPRAFTPTVTQSTPDPSEEMERLGNPAEFDKKCAVLKLTFEKLNGKLVFDDSPQKNNMQLQDDARLLKDETETGRSVDFGNNGRIILKNAFKGKPKKSVAVSMWVKLNAVKGTIPLLTATDDKNFVRYDLLLRDGKGVWVHRADSGRDLFRVQSSSPDITAGQWHNIVGSYDSVTKTASLWVDGKQVSKQEGIDGVLSQKWSKLTVFGGEKTHGYMDNIFMFRCPLDKTKIVALYVSAASPKDVKKDVISKSK